jgi:PAS domain S-box-containing protein
MGVVGQLFSSGGFEALGFCATWNAGLVWLRVVSDFLISASYFAILGVLFWVVRRRSDIPFSFISALFGAFIVACGFTHLMEVWNLWHAQYWHAGSVKVVTAIASVGTAVALTYGNPRHLQVPNLSDWAKADADLEIRVAERTADLTLANEELRESRETLCLAQREGKIGTWERDLVTGRSSFSPELEELLGLPPGGANGDAQALRDLLHPDDRMALEGARADAIYCGHAYVGKVPAIRPDGALRWLFTRTSIIRDAAGRPLRIVGVSVDVTERKQAEDQVRAVNTSLEARLAACTLELSNANNELESFSYSVSHDLRAPLRAIDGFSLALLEDCGDQLDEASKGHLQRIRSAVQHMGALIDDLLNLSRVARAPFNAQSFDLSAIVSDVAQELQASQPDRNIAWKIQPGVLATGDAKLLRVAMENLLNNAWKFTSRHAQASIEFGKTQNDGASAFFVKDDGAGFDPAFADRLFGAFQRLHSATEFPGTGVGLATVQRVIRRHGGHIWADSSLGHGATFFFTLPDGDSLSSS